MIKEIKFVRKRKLPSSSTVPGVFPRVGRGTARLKWVLVFVDIDFSIWPFNRNIKRLLSNVYVNDNRNRPTKRGLFFG